MTSWMSMPDIAVAAQRMETGFTYGFIAIHLVIFAAVIGLMICFILFFFNRRKNEQLLKDAAYTDPLTGCANEVQFRMNAKQLLKTEQYRNGASLICMDVVKFKYINEIFGYEIGDWLLCGIAKTIEKSLKTGEIFSRIYTDHFAVLLPGTEESAERRVQEILAKIISGRLIHQEYYQLSIKAGICCFNADEERFELVLNQANTARRYAKDQQNLNYAFYTAEMHENAEREKMLERNMASALRQGYFVPYIQPRCDLFLSRSIGGEALVRWLDPERGVRPPDEYIPFFEQNGFITEVDRSVFEQVCVLIRKWMEEGYEIFPISVNISRRQLECPDFADWYGQTAEKYAVPTNLIELELTEGVAFYDMERLYSVMKKLKEYGFILSLDDFGSEYSSLNILRKLPVDIVKLDKAFFSKEHGEREQIVIESCVDMCHKLGILVICEGVETQEQVDFLRQIGCHLIQGYWFAAPMPVAEYEKRFLNVEREVSASV